MTDDTVAGAIQKIDQFEAVEFTAGIVAAFVSNNSVPASGLAELILSVHAGLLGLGKAPAAAESPVTKATPAQIKKSITPEGLVSFEDGRAYKTLKRHLTGRGLTPEGYRAKYGLPADYPMVSSDYSAHRSALAQSLGLGRKGGRQAPAAAEPVQSVLEAPAADAPKPRGGRRKAAAAETAPKGRTRPRKAAAAAE
ncbi:MucR family transcriptional regulator [Methylobacterium iners]|uniref:MucR family transcriptional regulator n=1 Tax=Methylobacterium iners TaxID=418707 RepID=A0ABQ4S6U5_9HYPH|nr:MucR family transcriptional regulator [Methylobacterium iners]GJD97847.1 hypothetical protein OCOJLMKI_5086 [Methylobacterium iners]